MEMNRERLVGFLGGSAAGVGGGVGVSPLKRGSSTGSSSAR